MIVEVKAMYKREDLNVKHETLNKPCKHCVFPERGGFWICFTTNLFIEPDTSGLGETKDKPMYNADGTDGGNKCYCTQGRGPSL